MINALIIGSFVSVYLISSITIVESFIKSKQEEDPDFKVNIFERIGIILIAPIIILAGLIYYSFFD